MKINRLVYNLKIIKALASIILRHKDLRFCQILTNLELDKDRYNEEPNVTLDKIYASRIYKSED